jgi:mannose/cellobiose epimerase-like protein (N-acyl-D-glucosamine 2-epimerase family)
MSSKSLHVFTSMLVCVCLTSPATVTGGQAGAMTTKKVYTRIPAAEIKKHVDREWVRKSQINDLLDYWVKASVMPNGFIQENLDRQWKPWGEQREASVNGQGRVLYTLAVGYEMSGGDKRYLDAIDRAAGFLLKMRDEEHGGYYNRVTPDLKVIDDSKTGFQSFVIFSLAHAGRVTKNEKYISAAMTAYRELKQKMADGPFISGNLTRDFSKPATRIAGFGPGPGRPGGPGGPSGAPGKGGGGFQMAPGGHRLNLHMFEALMALYEANRSKEVWETITAQLEFMAKVFDYEVGYLPESYDANWKPVGNPSGNPGHLFEWASLLSRAVELGADPKFIELGSRTLDLGLKSYNKDIGGLGGRTADGAPARMLWWPQCEVIKATAHYAILRGRPELWPYYHQTLDFVKKNYLDTQYGGWFESYLPGSPREALGERATIKGAVDGPELSPYHQTSMFHDLWRITANNYKPEADH